MATATATVPAPKAPVVDMRFPEMAVATDFTTVKVSRATHAKLKEGAKAFHSIDAYLDYLLKMEERRQMVAAARVAISKTSPEDMESYRAESEIWERASLEDMAASGI